MGGTYYLDERVVYSMWRPLSRHLFFTVCNNLFGRSQSSKGLFSQLSKGHGMSEWLALLINFKSFLVVVAFLERWSANLAESVDILGRCWTVTQHPRNAEIRCRVFIKIEADSSFVTFLESQPNTIGSLSVRRRTSLPTRCSGQQRKGRIMATASSVGDLQP